MISDCIMFCFFGDSQTYRMIYLSKFMYEVYGVKRRKKLQFQGYIQKQKNCQGTHYSAEMKYFGLYENILYFADLINKQLDDCCAHQL